MKLTVLERCALSWILDCGLPRLLDNDAPETLEFMDAGPSLCKKLIDYYKLEEVDE